MSSILTDGPFQVSKDRIMNQKEFRKRIEELKLDNNITGLDWLSRKLEENQLFPDSIFPSENGNIYIDWNFFTHDHTVCLEIDLKSHLLIWNNFPQSDKFVDLNLECNSSWIFIKNIIETEKL